MTGETKKSAAGLDGSRGWRRPLVVLLVAAALALAGCSAQTTAQLKRFGLPEASSDRAPHMLSLWTGTWIAALIVGVMVWGLIGWVSLRYKNRGDLMPRQNRYNLPMEVFYTIAPFIIIGVLFYYTIIAQDKITERVPNPDHTIDVVGQKWAWTFNYKEAGNPAVGNDVYEVGTINKTPDLYLPVNKSVHFNLSSPDVIHSFWIPSFYEKLDVVPGRANNFFATPIKIGVFAGKCAELCGTYHSAMIFNVHVVSEADYTAYLKTLAAKGQIGEAKGPKNANAPASAGDEARKEGAPR